MRRRNTTRFRTVDSALHALNTGEGLHRLNPLSPVPLCPPSPESPAFSMDMNLVEKLGQLRKTADSAFCRAAMFVPSYGALEAITNLKKAVDELPTVEEIDAVRELLLIEIERAKLTAAK